MPVTNLINNACNFAGPEQTADIMYQFLQDTSRRMRRGSISSASCGLVPRRSSRPWSRCARSTRTLEFEVVDPYTFFRLLKAAPTRLQARQTDMNSLTSAG